MALIEIVSPGNKDRRSHVEDFATKVVMSLRARLGVLVIDLFPPRRSAPDGMHAAIWEEFDAETYRPPADAPLVLAAYHVDADGPEALLEPTAVGRELTPMPLFLTADDYVLVPLEATYGQAWTAMPVRWRRVIEGLPA